MKPAALNIMPATIKKTMKKTGKDKQAAKKTGKDKQPAKKTGKDKQPAKKTGKAKQPAKKTGKAKQAAKKTGKAKLAAKKTRNEKKPRKAPVITTTVIARSDIRAAATNDLGRNHHEPPRPQYFASGLDRPTLYRNGMDVEKQVMLDSVLSQLVVEDFSTTTHSLTGRGRATDCGDETEKACCVCFMEYTEGDKRLRLPCLHVFHDDCIRPWFRNRSEVCPVCRISVIDAMMDSV